MLDDLGLRLPQIDLVWTVRAFFAHFGLGFWTVLITAKLFKAVFRPGWFKGRSLALFWLSFGGGIVNNLVDLDHFSMLRGHPHGRVWHTPAAWFGMIVIVIFLIFWIGSSHKGCDRPGCPECGDEALARWRRWFGIAALMGVSVIAHVLEDYYIGAF